MIVDMLLGRKVKSVYNISKDLISNWSGKFNNSNYNEDDLHRLIIKLLILDVLKD